MGQNLGKADPESSMLHWEAILPLHGGKGRWRWDWGTDIVSPEDQAKDLSLTSDEKVGVVTGGWGQDSDIMEMHMPVDLAEGCGLDGHK